MNLYFISQSVNCGYDTFDSAVVSAGTPSSAKNIHPGTILKGAHPELNSLAKRLKSPNAESSVRRSMRVKIMNWDDQYRAGQWDGLADECQRPRLAAIGAICHGHVLDVGCGTGELRPFIAGQYTGLDISSQAIERGRWKPGDHLICSPVERFSPVPHAYDTIVLNESLYYCDRPFQVLDEYVKGLKSGGSLIVSIYARRWLDRNWQTLRLARKWMMFGELDKIVVKWNSLKWTVLKLKL